MYIIIAYLTIGFFIPFIFQYIYNRYNYQANFFIEDENKETVNSLLLMIFLFMIFWPLFIWIGLQSSFGPILVKLFLNLGKGKK